MMYGSAPRLSMMCGSARPICSGVGLAIFLVIIISNCVCVLVENLANKVNIYKMLFLCIHSVVSVA